MNTLASFLEEHAVDLINDAELRVAALPRAETSSASAEAQTAGLLRTLVAALRSGGRSSPAPDLPSGADLAAYPQLARALKDAVWDAIDGTGAAISARQARLIADWFAVAIEQGLRAENLRAQAAVSSSPSAVGADDHFAFGESNMTVLGIVGHDLRTPLCSVLALATHLQRRSDISHEVRDRVARISRSAKRMNHLIETIVETTRLRFQGDLTLSTGPVDLGAIASDVVEELRAAHPNRTIEVAASGDLRGTWDGVRLGQVVSNLVGNALTHGAEDTPVSLSVSEETGDVVLAVTNRGATIPPTSIHRLFEPFWQLPPDGRGGQRRAGLGLGLFIVQQIVLAHGGNIDVRSSAGVTRFAVRLPQAVQSQPLRAPTTAHFVGSSPAPVPPTTPAPGCWAPIHLPA